MNTPQLLSVIALVVLVLMFVGRLTYRSQH
jgi:hypothetical protein